MEKKVYEGYKRTSSRAKATTKAKTTKANLLPMNDDEDVSQVKSTKTVRVKPANKNTGNKPRLAMFIDVDNTGISRENLLEILFFANGKYQIELCKLYGFSDDTLPGIREIATEYNLVTDGRMKFKQPGVNCLDSRLLVDAYECALNNSSMIDMIFVWCYPCDLENLFEKIINLGINTATIDNAVFDCKNKYVSQTFKLYSQYDFNPEQSMYGKIKNELANIDQNVNLENTQLPISETNKTDVVETPAESTLSQPTMIDGVIPPVLPRRTVLERSSVQKPKTGIEPAMTTKPESETETNDKSEESDAEATSLVDEIARKLNLRVPTEEESSAESEKAENENQVNADLFMQMLKRAGLDNLVGENVVKYEDTIGDL